MPTKSTRFIQTSAYDVAETYLGLHEVIGPKSNPQILAMLQLDQAWPQDDADAWCSAFANKICHDLRLPRSRSLAARSWLTVGTRIAQSKAEIGLDVVVLSRGGGKQPGPEVLDAQGHVGFFGGWTPDGRVLVLAGNQGDAVNVAAFTTDRILAIQRLA